MSKIRLYAIGDVHIGSLSCDIPKLRKLVQAIQSDKEAKVLLLGDIFEIAENGGKTSDPFDVRPNELELAVDILSPIRRKIIGGITGNHEMRILRRFNWDPCKILCESLGVQYFGQMTEIVLNTHRIFAHHGAGGGRLLGAHLNALWRLAEICRDADLYICGHLHTPCFASRTAIIRGEPRQQCFWGVSSWLPWPEYAKAKALPPGSMCLQYVEIWNGIAYHQMPI